MLSEILREQHGENISFGKCGRSDVQNAIPPSAIAHTINICAHLLATQQVGTPQQAGETQKVHCFGIFAQKNEKLWP